MTFLFGEMLIMSLRELIFNTCGHYKTECPNFILELRVQNPDKFRKKALKKYFKSYLFCWDYYEINQRYIPSDNISLLFKEDKYGNIKIVAAK